MGSELGGGDIEEWGRECDPPAVGGTPARGIRGPKSVCSLA